MEIPTGYSTNELLSMLFAGGAMVVAAGKFLISDWASKSKENIELKAKMHKENFLKVEKDIDGLGTSFRSFKNEMYTYTKLINKLEFQLEAMSKNLDECIKDMKQLDPHVRAIARQEIEISRKRNETNG